MDRLNVRDLRRADDRRNVQIAERQLRGPDADSLIRKTYRQGIAVRLAVNSDRADAQFLARANHAQCNLPAIGNQNLFEHWLESSAGVSPAVLGASRSRTLRSEAG